MKIENQRPTKAETPSITSIGTDDTIWKEECNELLKNLTISYLYVKIMKI